MRFSSAICEMKREIDKILAFSDSLKKLNDLRLTPCERPVFIETSKSQQQASGPGSQKRPGFGLSPGLVTTTY